MRQKPAGHGTEHHARRGGIRQAAGQQQAQIFLFGKNRECCFIRIRRDHHFGENRRNAFRRRRIQLAIGRHNAAECRNGVTQQRAIPGLRQIRRHRYAARIGVLHNHYRRISEFGKGFKGRIGVVQIGIGKLLALNLPRSGNPWPRAAIQVKRRRLMRVFAVAQRLAECARKAEAFRKFLPFLLGEPAGNRSIIGSGARIGRRRQAPTRGQAGATRHLNLCLHLPKMCGFRQHRDMGVILGRAADHGRATNIYVFDAVIEIGTLRNSRFERVEIDRHQINRRNVMGRHLRHMLGQIAPAQNAAMHLRHQCFHASIKDFRKARMVGHILHRHAGVAQRLGGAAGGENLHPARCEETAKFNQSGFVGNGNQGAARRNHIGHGGNPSKAPWALRPAAGGINPGNPIQPAGK